MIEVRLTMELDHEGIKQAIAEWLRFKHGDEFGDAKVVIYYDPGTPRVVVKVDLEPPPSLGIYR